MHILSLLHVRYLLIVHRLLVITQNVAAIHCPMESIQR